LIAEDHTGWDAVTKSPAQGGLGFNAKWELALKNLNSEQNSIKNLTRYNYIPWEESCHLNNMVF